MCITSFLVMVAILILTLVSIQRERDYFRRELEDQASLLLRQGNCICGNGEWDLDCNALLARADQALYQSKEKGRNQVSVWQEQCD